MRLRFYPAIFAVLFYCLSSFAQKPRQLLAEGDKQYQEGNYYAAGKLYLKAWEQDSFNLEWAWKVAEAHFYLQNFPVAWSYYQRVYKKDQGKIYPSAVYQIGICEFNSGKYRSARKWFEKYSRKNQKKATDEAGKAAEYIKRCDAAQMLQSQRSHLVVKRAPDSVNTVGAEFAATENDSILYFTAFHTEAAYPEVYYIPAYRWRKSGKKKLKCCAFSDSTGIANIFFPSDRDEIYFTVQERREGVMGNSRIFRADFKGGELSACEALPSYINDENYTSTQPAVFTIKGVRYLFFASNRPGGMGGMDLWYSVADKQGNWEKPVNAGSTINTPADEITPFYCNPCEELFFSSTGHYGLGGFDIFSVPFPGPGEVSNPGPPINSFRNDLYFRKNNSGTRFYLTSNREGSLFEKYETCCNDIYFVQPDSVYAEPDTVQNQSVSLKGNSHITDTADSIKVTQQNLRNLVPLTLYFNNDEPDPRTTETTTAKTYTQTYRLYMAQKQRYIDAYIKGLKGEDISSARESMESFFTDSVEAGFLKLEQFTALTLELLKKGQRVSITLKGYCSPLASTAYNKNLAMRRISSLVNYFNAYENHSFLPYMNTLLQFTYEEIGELKAGQMVSDNPADVTRSVYSLIAAAERKIEIIAIAFE